MEKNLTTGSVFGNIVRFSLPYLFSYFLQTLYGMADLFIIGQYADASGTTAVSVGSQVMHMLTLMIVGLAMGATVTIGQAVGARDQKSAARYTGNTMTLFLVLSVAVTGLLLALARPIAAVMSTPAEAASGTVAYLRICFLGVPLITAYNIIASVFRGLGDSKRPMYFIAVACAVNIALDYLFIGALHMGPAGAALGTTLAQAVSVACVVTTSSTSRMDKPLTRGSAAKAPRMFFLRAAASRFVCDGVERMRRSRSVRTGRPAQRSESACAIISLWLYPRRSARSQCSGTGTMQSIVQRSGMGMCAAKKSAR